MGKTEIELFLWVICIIVIVTIIGAVGAIIAYVIENQRDRHTVIAVVADLAVTMFHAGGIRSVIPVNLVLIHIEVFLIYLGMRALSKHPF